MVTGRKGREGKKKVRAYQWRVTFVTGKIIGRMTASISKSG